MAERQTEEKRKGGMGKGFGPTTKEDHTKD